MSIPLSFYETVRLEYPRWDGELPSHYVARLRVLAGAVKREDADEIAPDENIELGHDPSASREAWRENEWTPAQWRPDKDPD